MLQVEEIQHFFRMSEDEEKVKLRRLEPAIQKFTKIVIPTDLERLRKHQINIEKVSFFLSFFFSIFFFFYHKKQLHILIYMLCISPTLRILDKSLLLKHLAPVDLTTLFIFSSGFSVLQIPLSHYSFFRKGYKNRINAFLVIHSDELSS